MTVTNKIPRNNLVLNNPKAFNIEDIFVDKICVTIKMDITKPMNNTVEKNPRDETMMKNQTENPTDTAIALNLGDEKSILDRIN